MSLKILNNNLKNKSFSALYYIFGEEEYLKEYYFSEIKKCAVTELPEFNVIEFDSKNFEYIDFTNAVNSYPVMSDKKLVTVTDFDNSLLKKDFTKEFVGFLKNIPDYCIVVFFDTALKSVTASNPLEKAISSAGGVAVQVKKPDISSLSVWAKKHFASAGKAISNDDLHYLIEIADNDMMSLGNEISKLCNYVEGESVTKDDIDRLVTKSIEANRFEIVDAFCAKNYTKIFHILDKLYKQCIDEIMIANIFYRAFSDMWKAKLAIISGKTSAELANDFKLNPYAANKIIKNSKMISKNVLDCALMLSLKLDKDLKSTPFNKKDLIITYISDIIDRRERNE